MAQPKISPEEPGIISQAFGRLGPYPFVFSAGVSGYFLGRTLLPHEKWFHEAGAQEFRRLMYEPNMEAWQTRMVDRTAKWMQRSRSPRYVAALLSTLLLHTPFILYSRSSQRALKDWNDCQEQKAQARTAWVDHAASASFGNPSPEPPLPPLSPPPPVPTRDAIPAPPARVQGPEEEKPMVHKIEEANASVGYAQCFGAWGLTGYAISRWPQVQSVEALENWVCDQDLTEQQRREYCSMLRHMRSRGIFRPVRSISLCVTGLALTLPLFGSVWLIKRRVRAREDDTSTQ